MTRPLALSAGDPAGVGAEIIAKAWAALRHDGPSFVVVGDAQLLASAGGGVYNFGNTSWSGSPDNGALNQPVVGIAADPQGTGYWAVASDGGVFSFGDAGFHGSTGGLTLVRPVVGMAAAPGDTGYWLVASDGGIFAFDAPYAGSLGGTGLTDVVGLVT